jgi:subtilisin family serine protease
MSKLTELVEKMAFRNILVPVITKSKKGKVNNVFNAIKNFTEEKAFFKNMRVKEQDLFDIFPLRRIKKWNMVSSILPKDSIFALADSNEVQTIFYDQPMRAFQYPYVLGDEVYSFRENTSFTTTQATRVLMGADIANAKGYTGKGQNVGVVDTGGSRNHPQIKRNIFKSVMPQLRDENGHGTWCATCIGGIKHKTKYYSTKLKRDVYCQGMAPECNLLSVKALGYYIGTGSTSGIIQGLEYATSSEGGNCKVLNLSLGGPAMGKSPLDTPYYEVFADLKEQNIIPVVAAGNSGDEENTVGNPGDLEDVLTVGAYDSQKGDMAWFSSRGPTNWGTVKPDCIAPGVDIVSGTVGLMDLGMDFVKNWYSPASGTSMACPHVTGLVACMRQAYFEAMDKPLSMNEIKAMLEALGSLKNNISGWGPITWGMFEEWMTSQYGVVL